MKLLRKQSRRANYMKVAKSVDEYPDWARTFPWLLIDEFSKTFKIDSNLIAAIIKVESGGNAWVSRFEPDIKSFYLPRAFARKCGQTETTEQIQQGMSFGLMQILGLTARRFGFDQPLGRLFDVPTNLYYGSKLLEELKGRYETVSDQVAAYNAGRVSKAISGMYVNQLYVDKVMLRYREMTKLKG